MTRVFGGNRPLVDSVHVAGEQVVSGGRHRDAESIGRHYREALRSLLST